jgi:hypothetical protein
VRSYIDFIVETLVYILVFAHGAYILDALTVADSVNRGISTARRMRATCTIGLSINEDLKLRKRKGRDKQ